MICNSYSAIFLLANSHSCNCLLFITSIFLCLLELIELHIVVVYYLGYIMLCSNESSTFCCWCIISSHCSLQLVLATSIFLSSTSILLYHCLHICEVFFFCSIVIAAAVVYHNLVPQLAHLHLFRSILFSQIFDIQTVPIFCLVQLSPSVVAWFIAFLHNSRALILVACC